MRRSGGGDLDDGRLLGAPGVGERAAVAEAAAGRRIEQGRWGALDAAERLVLVAGADLGQRADQHLRVRVAGLGRQRPRGGLLGELARVHHHDRVGDVRGQSEVVGHEDHAGDQALVAESREGADDRLLVGDVQGGGDLVGDEDGRVEQRGDHHDGALLHSPGQLDRIAVQDVAFQADQGEPPVELVRVHGDAPGGEEFADHAADAAGRVERAHRVLGHERDLVEAVGVHRPVVGERQFVAVQRHGAAHVPHPAVEADEGLAQGGLAAAGLARQAQDLAVRQVEADAVQGPDLATQRAVVDPQIVDGQGHVVRTPSASG